jgi:hypothetical protein
MEYLYIGIKFIIKKEATECIYEFLNYLAQSHKEYIIKKKEKNYIK